MNKYETIIIISDKIDTKERDNVIKKVKTFIKNNGEIEEIKEIGMRKLAYEVKKSKCGYYLDIFFKAESEKISELERMYRYTDEILKFITIRM